MLIRARTGFQQTWQSHPGKEQEYFLLKQSIFLTKILKYPIVVHPMKFPVPGMILQVLDVTLASQKFHFSLDRVHDNLV